MDAYRKYFAKVTYKPKYYLGDRVRGLWNKIPYSGTVAIDHKINDEPPSVKIFLDLPVKHRGIVYNMITVSHRGLEKL